MIWQTSSLLQKSSTVRSQTARPSNSVNCFFSLAPNREELPAAGKITQAFIKTTRCQFWDDLVLIPGQWLFPNQAEYYRVFVR